MARFKNMNWSMAPASNGAVACNEHAILATLMDLRDELQVLNRVFRCPNFLAIPSTLEQIEKNTKKRKYTRRAAK